MNGFTKLPVVLCMGLIASAVSCPAFAAMDEQISARFNALEKENAALRARLNRIEASKESSKESSRQANVPRRPAEMGPNPTLASAPMPQKADSYVVGSRQPLPPRFEVSGSLLFLQPGAGNLEYGTLTTPLPLPPPSG